MLKSVGYIMGWSSILVVGSREQNANSQFVRGSDLPWLSYIWRFLL